VGRLIVQQFVSADGFATDADGDFTLFDQARSSSAGIDLETLRLLRSVDAIVLGALTYRMFVEYWPTPRAEEEVLAPRINELPKIVVSRRLDTAPWGRFEPASIIGDDAVAAIRLLKADLPGDLIVWGSLTLTESLFEAGLVDVVRLVQLPLVIGAGRGVFPPTLAGARLRLERSNTFDDGLVALEYAVTGTGPEDDRAGGPVTQ
jgi:dihydrofolate reductase